MRMLLRAVQFTLWLTARGLAFQIQCRCGAPAAVLLARRMSMLLRAVQLTLWLALTPHSNVRVCN